MAWLDFALPCLYSFLACVGFCIVYDLRGKVLVLAPLGGSIGWLVYLCTAFTGNDIAQYFLATVAVAVYAEIMARLDKAPVTGYLIVALIPMVPGGGIYYTMEQCILGNMEEFARMGAHTFGIAGALALGILLVSAFTKLLHSFRLRLRREEERRPKEGAK